MKKMTVFRESGDSFKEPVVCFYSYSDEKGISSGISFYVKKGFKIASLTKLDGLERLMIIFVEDKSRSGFKSA